MISIRSAEEDDLPRVAEIHVASWRASYRGIIPDEIIDARTVSACLDDWCRWWRGEGVHLDVATENTRVVAFARSCPARDIDDPPQGFAELTHLYVDPHRNSQGVGTALLSCAIERARTNSDRGLLLWTLEGNDPARRFYERRGLRTDGARHSEPAWLGEGVFEVRYRVGFSV